MKEFNSRDAATSFLRRRSIPNTMYNSFITKVDDVFQIDEGKVEKYLADGAAMTKDPEIKKSKTKVVKHNVDVAKDIKKDLIALQSGKEATASIRSKSTVTSVCCDMILTGKTNAEVWAIVKVQFSLDDSKKSYPAWYRSKLMREGKLK